MATITRPATLREGRLCRREGITINIFLLPGWFQSREDVQFAYRLAESTSGRVFFTAGKDRACIWHWELAYASSYAAAGSAADRRG